MKKVLSVAMASAMVLGMGANAFAIKYNTASNDTAKWPTEGIKFDGELFVTDKDNNFVKGANTAIATEEKVDFQAGDVIWMPLYAKNQVEYKSEIVPSTPSKDAVTVRIDVKVQTAATNTTKSFYKLVNGVWNVSSAQNGTYTPAAANTIAGIENWIPTTSADLTVGQQFNKTAPVYTTVTPNLVVNNEISYNGEKRALKKGSEVYYVDTTKVTKHDFDVAAALGGHTLYVAYDLAEVKGTNLEIGGALNNNVVSYGHYTGNIDKNWSVNLIEEKGTTLTDIVEKAELYKATEKDFHSYSKYTDEIAPNAVYVRVHLKDDWKFCKDLNLKYYVYVADNAGHQTENKVWVSGKYAAAPAKTVDFTWSNDASVASLWKAKENGVAVFDFADKAFFTVKMYKDECLYLDLDAAYKTATAKDFDSEIDSFYYFDTENANFIREGELVIVSDNADLAVYEIAEDEIFDMEAEYVTNYAVAHTNEKINGYVFNTAELGKYVLADEIVVEDEDEAKDEKPAEEVKPSEDAKEETVKPNKVNPNTGANDFVGLAVSLAVVSVAAAGALALKK